MRKNGAILIFLVLNVLPLYTAYSQDPQFTQFYSNPLYLGPSFAGAIEGSRFSTNYRNQWPGLPVSFQTISFSFDHYFSNFNSGVGILALKDQAGSGNMGILNLGIQYSYNFQIFNVWHVRPGLHFYYTEMGLDYFKLRLYNDVLAEQTSQPVFNAPVAEKARDVDAGTSVLIYSERIWGGASVDHLLKPNLSLYANKYIVPLKVSFYGGYVLIKNSRLLNPIDETLTFASLFKMQNNQKQLDLGLYWHKSPLVFGAWYRGIPPSNSPRGDAIALLVGYKIDQFSVGYSYDFTISNLLPHTWGAHEVSLVYKFKMPKRKKRPSMVPCPEF